MKDYKFTFTEQEINYILSVLAKQPYIDVAELIGKIHQQAAETEGTTVTETAK